MRVWNYEQLAKEIDTNKSLAEQKILNNKSPERLVRRRVRDKQEQKILDNLCIMKWKDAEERG